MNSKKGTSGILLTENQDGGLKIQYIDYEVAFFGGSDYEATYNLTAENAEKLKMHLDTQENENLKDSLSRKFGPDFNDYSFRLFCEIYHIEYEYSSWVS